MHKDLIEAGCDEAGRGCLAGPVFAAAVILPRSLKLPGLNDSKKLNAKQRSALRQQIEESAICFQVAQVSPLEIDEVNILNASFRAMHLAIAGLKKTPEFLLIDGNRFSAFRDIPYTCIVKGDAKYKSIAAASILAKTYRDEYMEKLDINFPQYAWKQNKGYPTLEHKMAIVKHGLSIHHRQSFNHSIQGKLF